MLSGVNFVIFGCILCVSAVPLNNSPLKFEVDEEWNLIPDFDGKLTLMHRDDILRHIPESRFDPETDMRFIVHTRSNPTAALGQVVTLGDIDSLKESFFNPEHPTRFTIHGWGGSTTGQTNSAPRNAYLSIGDYNCIVVDWVIGAAPNNYITARNNVPAAGLQLARFIDFLVKEGGQSLSQILISGFSLGGQVAGLAGKQTTVGLVHSIIALDPAGPLFSATNPAVRVDSTDAQYVELIITNGGVLGMSAPVGHCNFYPNGGRNQPGCGIDVSGNCAHGRAVTYFAESITSLIGFWGNRCKTNEELANATCTGEQFAMGGEPTLHGSGALGSFHFITSDTSPFAQPRDF